jgi:hypothetical protein
MVLRQADEYKTRNARIVGRCYSSLPRMGLRIGLWVLLFAGMAAGVGVASAAASAPNLHQLSLQLAVDQNSGKPANLGPAPASSNGAAHQLYQSTDIVLNWSKYSRHYQSRQVMEKKYLSDVRSLLARHGAELSGSWLITQAKFILAELAIPDVNEIEYWSGTPRVRMRLAPLASLARHLLADARRRYTLTTNRLNNLSNFTHQDEKLYETASAGLTQIKYFGAYADYYRGLSLSRRSPKRDGLMLSAVKAVAQWANGPASNGVKFQSLLLSGKANMRAGRTADAVADIKLACKPPSPAWLVYEAHYQLVVAELRGGHYGRAAQDAANFKTWLTRHRSLNTDSARMGLHLLNYRIAAAKAGAIHSSKRRQAALAKAMNLLLPIIAHAPQYQELIFTHITSGLPAAPDMSKIAPMQVLAIAWTDAQKNNPAAIKTALAASEFLLHLPNQPPALKAQAQLIAGICWADRGDIQKAARINLAFVTENPTDKQALPVLNIALSQLQQLNQASNVSAAVTHMTQQAIALAYEKFHEKQWRFAYGVSLQQARHYRRAEKIFAGVPPGNPQYIQAQYQLVRIRARKLTQLMAADQDPISIRSAARRVIRSARALVAVIDHPPPHTPPDVVKQARAYRPQLLMLIASTALDPLHEPLLAGTALDQLDTMAKSLSNSQRGIVLRYRIRQYQLMGKTDDILPLIRRYARGSSENADDVIKGLIGQYLRESRRLRHSDRAKSQSLAASAASLLKQLINAMSKNPKKNKLRIYVYNQLRAQELIYAGEPEHALALYKKLEKQNPRDLGNFIGGARAAYAVPNYSLAHSLYVRIIPKLEPDSSLYWEAYLYLIRSNIRSNRYQKETVQTLKSLVAIYGSTIGGKYYHRQYEKLLRTYDLTVR